MAKHGHVNQDDCIAAHPNMGWGNKATTSLEYIHDRQVDPPDSLEKLSQFTPALGAA